MLHHEQRPFHNFTRLYRIWYWLTFFQLQCLSVPLPPKSLSRSCLQREGSLIRLWKCWHEVDIVTRSGRSRKLKIFSCKPNTYIKLNLFVPPIKQDWVLNKRCLFCQFNVFLLWEKHLFCLEAWQPLVKIRLEIDLTKSGHSIMESTGCF